MRETLLGGQAFRWNESSPGLFTGSWEGNVVRLRLNPQSRVLEYSYPEGGKVPKEVVAHYLGMDCSWELWANRLPWRLDPCLKQAMDAFPGLRILVQSPEETLLTFLCSSNKQIVQIKRICEDLSRLAGRPAWDGSPFHRLPSWKELVEVAPETLRASRMGYRAGYVTECAQFLSANPAFLKAVQSMPTHEARVHLQKLPGVGPKVAECVLLFGYQRLDAFPMDTWILKILEWEYGLKGWKKAQIEQFVRIHFGSLAGYAQQFLFAHVRARSAGGFKAVNNNPVLPAQKE